MKITLTTILLTISVVMFMPARSSAGWWAYFNHVGTCSGAGGCRSQFEYSSCFLGCVSGECNNDGGSGECCGNHYFSAVIYPDGGDCHGGSCGFIRVHIANKSDNSQKS